MYLTRRKKLPAAAKKKKDGNIIKTEGPLGKAYLIGHDFLSSRLAAVIVGVNEIPDGAFKPRFEDDGGQSEHGQFRRVPRWQAADVHVRVGR